MIKEVVFVKYVGSLQSNQGTTQSSYNINGKEENEVEDNNNIIKR